jgi:mono/diheme cytochrome c family protein
MKTAVKIAGALVALVILIVTGAWVWVSRAAQSRLSTTFETHSVEIPMPWPLSEQELASLGEQPPGTDLDALAMERAIDRGRHLVDARFVCVECHGKDFGGGTMVDDPAIGKILGPNLTMGEGGHTKGYTMADWDRIVRHGVKPDGTPAAMPSEDFVRMSDQELSDVVAYIGTFEPVDATIPPPSLGPLGKVLMATGKLPLSAELVEDHRANHAMRPPQTAATVEFGGHLAGVCAGCHRAELNGGMNPAGPPDWPPAANLTPTNAHMTTWTYAQFDTVMRTGKRPDGTELQNPMSLVVPYAAKMTDTEMRALWLYLQSLESQPDGT